MWLCLSACLFLGWHSGAATIPADDLFRQGSQAYVAGGFEQAAGMFRQAVSNAPAAGTWQNLGNAEWQCGRTGPAVLAWERAQWLRPFNFNARANLRFARRAAQLEGPDLVWYEVCSSWLPVNAWAWIASVSFWGALGLVLLPGALRWRRADWHQGAAAAGLAIFILTIPALGGVHTRSKLGVILEKDTPLRLTATHEAQFLARLPAGDTARFERSRGDYVFIRTSTAAGWVERGQFGMIAANP